MAQRSGAFSTENEKVELAAFAALLAAVILFALKNQLGRFGVARRIAMLVSDPVPHLTEA